MEEVKLQDAPQNVRMLYKKGVAAMEHNNLEYAMDMFEAVLRIQPALLDARKLLRNIAINQVKAKPPGKLATTMAVGRLLLVPSQLNNNPLQALETTESLLRIDPLNHVFVKAQCDAAEASGLPKVALQTLEILSEHVCPPLALLTLMARLYRTAEHYDREYECRRKIAGLNPKDPAAQKELKDAAARLTMHKTSWQKIESYRDVF